MLRGNVYSSFILKQLKTIQSSSKQTESRVDETFLTLELFQSQTELTKMGDYPGSGYKMSSYGLKTYNPQETVGQWTQCCKVVSHLRLLCIIEVTVVRQVNFDLGFPVYLRLQSLVLTLVDPVCSRFAQPWDLVNYNLTDYSRKDFVVAYENLEPQEV